MFRSSRTASLLLVGLFLWVTGCTSYKQIQLGEVADHGKIRVTTTDGQRETIHGPRVEADSIKGHTNKGVESADWVAQAIAVQQVVELEAVGTNTASTVLLVIGFAAVIFFGMVVAACNGFECG